MIGYYPVTIGGSDRASPGEINAARTEALVVECEAARAAGLASLREVHYPFGHDHRAGNPAIDFDAGPKFVAQGLDWLRRLSAACERVLVYLGQPMSSPVIRALAGAGLAEEAAERIAACVRRVRVAENVAVVIDAATEAEGATAEALRIAHEREPFIANGVPETATAFRTRRLFVEDAHVLGGKIPSGMYAGGYWYNVTPPGLWMQGVRNDVPAYWYTAAGIKDWQPQVRAVAARYGLTVISGCVERAFGGGAAVV